MTPIQWVGLGFTIALVFFLMIAFFMGKSLSDPQVKILRFICAICAAFAGAILTGEALVKFEIATGPLKLVGSGTAGIGLFFVVWFTFGNYVAPDAVSFSVPKGWKFKGTVDAVAREANAVAEFVGFNPGELSQPLDARELETKSHLDLIRSLRALAKPNSIRPYEVVFDRPTYRLTVKV